MRQCEYKKHLSSYLDNQLNPLQENQVEEHLPLCNSCKEEWEELSKLKKLCSILPEEELPHGLHQRILTKVKMPRKSPRKYTWIQRVAVPLAAALFIFIAGKYGLNGFSGLFKSSESKPEGVLQEPVVMATHEADDNRALTAGEAPKDEGVTMDNVADDKARQENATAPDSGVEPESMANEKGSDNFNSGLQASEDLKAPRASSDDPAPTRAFDEKSKAPINKGLKFGIGFAGAVLMIMFLFNIAKRKR